MLTADIIPSHKVAQWLLSHIHRFLNWFGLEKDRVTEEFLYTAIIVIAALFIGWAIGNLVRMIVRKWVKVRRPELAQELVQKHVIVHCCRIIPPLVILGLLPFAFTGHSIINIIIMRGLLIYTSIVVCMAICSVSSFTWARLEEKRNTRNLPLRGILDTIIGILWVITVIVCVAILVNRSPVALLTGLGAFAAVLMLVFKDSILGLVAGLQLSQNDMLHVGDWIVVPSTIANGIVTDVSLTAVKVRNWDNTIVTLPPYTLVSGSFQNWRGMSQSGVRQIARSILVDIYTITQATPEFLNTIIVRFPILKSYIEKLETSKETIFDPGTATVNGTIETNLGLYRAYLCEWLLNHPSISSSNQILVRLLAPTEYGIPLQVWCFTSTTAWTAYEAIQSALFEHIAVTAPEFGLRLFNDTSGADVLSIDTIPDPEVLNQAASTPQESQEEDRQAQK
ncbi:mechanosensitive ion channel domain-containing protein [uncultured Duncaniella sp.]|uniref:mechanosensitive ion channel family protein n=1 Tax=uncultured Duncaniella sp. TaxID=2768039 RepID=UPI0025A9FECE|nr:mechanosensitive ion channel domain-containing protein [uncultured Duncaniella sp.]